MGQKCSFLNFVKNLIHEHIIFILVLKIWEKRAKIGGAVRSAKHAFFKFCKKSNKTIYCFYYLKLKVLWYATFFENHMTGKIPVLEIWDKKGKNGRGCKKTVHMGSKTNVFQNKFGSLDFDNTFRKCS